MSHLHHRISRWLRRLAIMVLILSAQVQYASAEERTLVFSPLPMESAETIVSQWKPFLEYLQQGLGIDIHINYIEDYADIIEQFSDNRIDLAMFGPLPYVRLRTQFSEATPLVIFHEPDGEPFYTCSIVALEELVTSRDHPQKMKIALTQSLSTCGYFSTNGLLLQHSSPLDQHLYRYLGKHDTVAIAVARGDFDAGGLKTTIGDKYNHLGLVEIARTEPLPAFSLIANGHNLSQELMDRIRQLIITAPPAQRSTWGGNIRHGAIKASDANYNAIRRLDTGITIPKRGNY